MESKMGSMLALIGGILYLIGAAITLIVGLIVLFVGMGEMPQGFGIAYIVVSVLLLALGLGSIKAAKLMKVPETTKKGGIIALILGIVFSNIVVLIGGILGLIDSGK